MSTLSDDPFDPLDEFDDDDEYVRRERPGWMGLVALLAAVGLIAGVLAVFLRDDSGPADFDPSSVSVPDDTAAAIAQIEVFVATERGLPFLREVAVDLADGDEFQERLLADFDDDVSELQRAGVVLHALGLLDTSVDPVEAYRRLLGAGIVGFYDPETDELVVRGSALTPYVRSIIAHELVHALDDQHFELHRPELDEAVDESGFGFSAVVEGDARRIEAAYRESLSLEEQQAAFNEEMSYGLDVDFRSAPPVLLGLLQAPYVAGEEFVDGLLDDGGQAALDAAIANPPSSSEQVLDPAAFFAGEPALEVPAPSADGDEIERGTLGSLLLAALLVDDPIQIALDPPALEGWGGDRYVSWRAADGSACLRANVVGDTEGDTEEIFSDLADWSGDRPGGVSATVVRAGPGAPVELTSCARP